MRRLIVTLFVTIVSFGTYSARFAVATCENQSLTELSEALKRNGNDVIGFFPEKNMVMVSANDPIELEAFCFVAEVRVLDHHFSFNTNRLLVKTDGRKLKGTIGFPHRFIPNLYTVLPNVRNDQELLEFKQKLLEQEEVELVNIDQVFTLSATVNDPLYNRQWALENTGSPFQYNGTPGADMSVDSAWTITTGDAAIKIAILDSGVDTLHEDLLNNLLPGFDGFADSINDTHGAPTPNYSGDGHGTSCAGIVAAEGDNGIGTSGIAYQSKIVPIRVFYYMDYGMGIGVQATTNTMALVDGAAYAWRVADVDIMSVSAGLSSLYIQALQVDTSLVNAEINAAYSGARNNKGIAMFFSAGNDNISDVLWPGNLASTIAVGATSMCDERKNPSDCSGENWGGTYGPGLDVSAPGVKIATSDIMGSGGFSNGNYTYTFNGTSAACPNAAGVGALILAVNPNLMAEDVRAIINMTADRTGGYVYDSTSVHGTWNNEMGHGRVNAFEAVKLAQTYMAGMSENSSGVHLSIFPNPSEGIIQLTMTEEKFFSIEVLDAAGRIVLSKKPVYSNQTTIDLTSMKGVFFVHIQGEKFDKIERVIIQ